LSNPCRTLGTAEGLSNIGNPPHLLHRYLRDIGAKNEPAAVGRLAEFA
jgi:hypothetical protein